MLASSIFKKFLSWLASYKLTVTVINVEHTTNLKFVHNRQSIINHFGSVRGVY